MHCASLLSALLATATLTLANTVTFRSQDSTPRTIVFTPSADCDEIPEAEVPGNAEVVVDFPHGWIGNWFSVSEGANNVRGMLGEVTFNGWDDFTWYDVSAIEDPDDHVGVKQLWPEPLGEGERKSGCETFPCDTLYEKPNDDEESLSTKSSDLVCTLGG